MNATILHFHQQQEQLVDDVCETLSARLGPAFIYANLDSIRRSIQTALTICERFGERDPNVVFGDICALTKVRLRAKQIILADRVCRESVPGIVYRENGRAYPLGKSRRKSKRPSPSDRDENNPSTNRNRYIHDHLESIC